MIWVDILWYNNMSAVTSKFWLIFVINVAVEMWISTILLEKNISEAKWNILVNLQSNTFEGFGKIYANASELTMLNRFMHVLNILVVKHSWACPVKVTYFILCAIEITEVKWSNILWKILKIAIVSSLSTWK